MWLLEAIAGMVAVMAENFVIGYVAKAYYYFVGTRLPLRWIVCQTVSD